MSHFLPGTSKWNKIEHRPFCHITEYRRGKALCSFETIVGLISHVRTATVLRVKVKLDKRSYPKRVQINKAEIKAVALTREDVQGDWNYALHPRAAGATCA